MRAQGYLHEFAARSAAVLGSQIETSITVRHHGVSARAASSTDAAARCDQVEARSAAGPCIDAMDHLSVTIVPDLDGEDRWLPWREQSVREGFRASLAAPAIITHGSVLAAVEDSFVGLYRRTSDEEVVERAVGAIMHLNGCTAQEAHAIFDSGAASRNVSRREVAETILQSLAPLDLHTTRPAARGDRD